MPIEVPSDARPALEVHVSVLFGERCIVLRGSVSDAERRSWIEGLAHELLPDYEICNELAVRRERGREWSAV
jgi:hypothetical protein